MENIDISEKERQTGRMKEDTGRLAILEMLLKKFGILELVELLDSPLLLKEQQEIFELEILLDLLEQANCDCHIFFKLIIKELLKAEEEFREEEACFFENDP